MKEVREAPTKASKAAEGAARAAARAAEQTGADVEKAVTKVDDV